MNVKSLGFVVAIGSFGLSVGASLGGCSSSGSDHHTQAALPTVEEMEAHLSTAAADPNFKPAAGSVEKDSEDAEVEKASCRATLYWCEDPNTGFPSCGNRRTCSSDGAYVARCISMVDNTCGEYYGIMYVSGVGIVYY